MRVIIDAESIEVKGNYYPLPTGNIYIENDEGAFPDYDYNDFVSILLGWWTDELINFAWGAKTVKLKFLDEHYFVHLVHEDDLNIVRFGETTLSGNEVIRESTFDMEVLTRSMASAVNALLRNEDFLEQMPVEAENLRRALGRLRQLTRKK